VISQGLDMSTPFVKFIGVPTAIASVVALGWSLYFPCNTSSNNLNNHDDVHHFDTDAMGSLSIFFKKMVISRQTQAIPLMASHYRCDAHTYTCRPLHRFLFPFSCLRFLFGELARKTFYFLHYVCFTFFLS
jgi:hypothetical protein